MSTLQMDAVTADTKMLRREVDDLKDRLARLAQANISIADSPDADAGLQEVVTSA